MKDCSVGSASIDFDIEGLAQVAWSGQGKKIKEVTQLKTTAGATSPAVTGEEYSTNGLLMKELQVLQIISDKNLLH